jgi:hypothetical protein
MFFHIARWLFVSVVRVQITALERLNPGDGYYLKDFFGINKKFHSSKQKGPN